MNPEWTARNEMIWHDPTGKAWTLEFRFELVGGRVACTRFCVWSHDGAPITTSVLRSMPLTRLTTEMRAQLDLPPDVPASPDSHLQDQSDAHGRLTAYQAPTRPGPPGPSALKLEAVGRIYSEAYRRGEAPTAAVAERLSISRSTAAKWVMKAREVGILGPATPRRAGGVPSSEPMKTRRTS